MRSLKDRIISPILLVLCLFLSGAVFAQETKYPNYANEFLGEDKYENYNRKMFGFNQKLNKYFLKPIHVVWASIMPQYGMDRILGISNNIEYPIRFVSCLVQGDFKAAGQESARFLINTTVGLAGMYDPAKHILKVEQVHENMDQALAKHHIEPKTYFVLPVISFTNYRNLTGRVLDAALNPTTYIGTPVLAAVKAGLTINRTSYFQTLINMLETNYADPYEVYKTVYGIDTYVKKNNYDRVEVLSQLDTTKVVQEKKRKKRTKKIKTRSKLRVFATISPDENYQSSPEYEYIEKTIFVEEPVVYQKTIEQDKTPPVAANIELYQYNPQSPFTDSMRTSLFSMPSAEKSIWNELSVWNRSFKKKIKTSKIELTKGKDNYYFRYFLQKDKNAPLAIIYPSIGEGAMSNHPTTFAKIFYDAGYSIVILGNPFHWEFVKSMDDDYRPGMPDNDAKMLKMATLKIIDKIQAKHNIKFNNKVVLGTSYGALVALHMAQQESKENTLGNAKFIAICPPVDLVYAMKQIDDNYDNIATYSTDEFKDIAGSVAAKAVKLYQNKKEIQKINVNNLPFSEDESRLLTGFIMHQKLSDIIFVLEKAPKNKKSDIYETINNMGYKEYSEKYLAYNSQTSDKKQIQSTKLTSISDYLKKGNNYKIYHSSNDYLTTKAHIKQLKQMSGDKLTVIDNGSHLGFLYRPEFIQDLLETILQDKAENL